MTRFNLLTIVTITMVLGAAITVEALSPAPSSTRQTSVVFAQSKTTETPRVEAQIIASPVIDREPDFFVGTGDGSVGSWTRR